MEVRLTPKQTEAFDILTRTNDDIVLYGGAKGGGKSFLGCQWVEYWLDYLIEFFAFQPTTPKYQPIVGFMGRLQGVDFDKTTLETWKKTVTRCYEIDEQKKEIRWRDRIKVMYGGLDKQETVNKFNSAELCFLFIDQAEETGIKDIGVLRGSLRFKYKGKQPPYKQLFTANPAECWLKSEFLPPLYSESWARSFIPALPSDNPHLPDNYINTLKDSFRYDENLLRAYLYGDWNVLSGFKQLLTLADVKACFHTQVIGYPDGDYKVIACDPARFGDDKTNIYLGRNEDIIEKINYGKKDTEYTYGVLRDAYDRMYQGEGRKPLFVLDGTDPFGAGGLVDRLNVTFPDQVLSINNSSAAINSESFLNKRAEIHADLRDAIKKREIRITEDDIELHQELTAIRYDYRNGKLFVEGKDQQTVKENGVKSQSLKERLGRSPNCSDTLTIWWAALKYLKSAEGKEKFPAIWVEPQPPWVKKRKEETELAAMNASYSNENEDTEINNMGLCA